MKEQNDGTFYDQYKSNNSFVHPAYYEIVARKNNEILNLQEEVVMLRGRILELQNENERDIQFFVSELTELRNETEQQLLEKDIVSNPFTNRFEKTFIFVLIFLFFNFYFLLTTNQSKI